MKVELERAEWGTLPCARRLINAAGCQGQMHSQMPFSYSTGYRHHSRVSRFTSTLDFEQNQQGNYL